MSNETKKLGPIALVGAGTIRTSFEKGEIAYDDIIAVLPFYDTVDSYELCGKYIAEALEYGASRRGNDSNYRARQMLQVSGLKYVINITKPDGNKISDIQVQCDDCSEPYVPLKYDEMYLVVSQNYLADGGVGFEMIATNHINRVRGDFDSHVLRDYLKNQTTPIYIEKSQRITVIK